MTHRDDVLANCRPASEAPFSKKEFWGRLERIRKLMAKARIDVLLVTAPEGMYYVSGYQCEWYQGQSPRQWPASSGIAIHVDRDRFIHFDTEREAVLTRLTSVAEDIRIFPPATMRDGIAFIASELEKEGWLPGTVGIEMHSYRPNRIISHRFQDALEAAGAKVVDGTDILREVRWVKSDAEMACLEEAARIADIGLGAAQAELRPGVMELEVYGAMFHAMTKAGGEGAAITMPVLSGQKTNAPHALASRKKIRQGELVLVDVSGVHKRYHCNMARTYSMGEPRKDVAELAAKACGSMAVLKSILRPNLPVAELNRTMKTYYEEHGLWRDRGWIGGYEMGIAFPPDWVGGFVYDPLSEINADRVFEPGTAVNYENQFFLPRHEGMYFMIETLLFKDTEARFASKVPYELTVIE
ncbi:MAG: Xaa-Pro peptidase family protein [Alphaproteobacteria bacterium]